ncbi:MAG: glycosyltransferase family 2 protein [Vicinamibacterales bacterium]
MDAHADARIAVAVVIVNYNAGPALADALRSLVDDTTITWDALVVDNASRDGSIEGVEGIAPWVRVIRNRENVGFACGVNQGLAATTADLVLLLNPDCTIGPGATAELAGVLQQYPDCAIVGPRILDPDGSIQGSARGDPDMLTGLFGRTSALRRLLPGAAVAKRNVVDVGAAAPGAASVVVDWLSGACMLARRSSVMRVGGFDERYFLYWEDADLCRRLRNAGMHVRYVPQAVAVHQVGRSSSTARAASIRAFHESAYLYYATHVAPGGLNPKRVIARLLLSARCWWRVRV